MAETAQLKELVQKVKDGNCVLFVGQETSIEAGAPDERELAEGLAKLIDYQLQTESLPTIAQYVEDAPGFGRSELVNFLVEKLRDLDLGASHCLIPQFPWPTVYTTNLDTLLEDGFDEARAKDLTDTQHSRCIRNEDITGTRKDALPIIKLYGCINDPRSEDAPLVVTKNDLLEFEDKRGTLVATLQSDLYPKPFLFLGCDLEDGNFQRIYKRIRQELERYQIYSYAVVTKFNEQQKRRWENIRLVPFKSSPSDFLSQLLNLVEIAEREKDAVLAERIDTSAKLLRLSWETPGFELLSKELFASAARKQVTYFYQGREPTWYDIVQENDAQRILLDEVMKELEANKGVQAFLPILGLAGSGKSTFLRRIGYDLYDSGETVFFYRSKPGDILKTGALQKFYEVMSRAPFYLLADDFFRLENYQSILDDIADRALPVTLIATSRLNEYDETIRANILELPQNGEPFELSAEHDTEAIVRKLQDKEMLPSLTDEQYEQFVAAARTGKGQLLVMMMELLESKDFLRIIRDELRRLRSNYPQIHRAYGYICVMHQIGPGMPIQLLERLIPVDDIYFDVIDNPGARGVIFRHEEVDWAVQSKHEYIAEVTIPEIYRGGRGLLRAYKQIIERIDVSNKFERNIVTRALSSLMIQDRAQLANQIIEECDDKIQRSQEFASITELIDHWSVIYHRLGKVAEENRCHTIALEKEPHYQHEYTFIVASLRRQDRFDEALTRAEEGLVAYPHSTSVIGSYANALKEWVKSGQEERALERIGKTLKDNPELSSIRGLYISMLGEQGRFEEAIAQASEGLQISPRASDIRRAYVAVLRKQVDVFREQEQFDEAIKVSQEGVELVPENAQFRKEYMLLLERARREEEAIEVGQEGVKLVPESAEFRKEYMLLLERTGREEEAIEVGREGVKLVPESTEFRKEYMLLVDRAGRKEEAIEVGREGVELVLENAAFYKEYMLLLERAGREKEAIKVGQQGVELVPDNADLRIRYANSLRNQRRYSEAEEQYLVVLEKSPGDLQAKYGYATTLSEMQRYKEAEEHFEILLGINPWHVMANNNYANMLKEIGRFGEAERRYKRALRSWHIEPQQKALVSNNIALLYIETGQNLQEAEGFLAKALKANPDFYWTYHNFGLLHEKLGQLDRAEESYRYFLKMCRDVDMGRIKNLTELFREIATDYELRKEDELCNSPLN